MYLDLRDNLLETVSVNFPKLQKLWLGGNKLTELKNVELPNILELDLSRNWFSIIDNTKFALAETIVINNNVNLKTFTNNMWGKVKVLDFGTTILN